MPSSYFSRPSDHLDPALFEGSTLRDNVREPIVQSLTDTLRKFGLRDVEKWLHLWLTGSGISYQWSADRGNGDLDFQMGAHYEEFLKANSDWRGISTWDVSSIVNNMLKQTLWVQMKTANINGKPFEITIYWNPDVTDDIELILPYAAYDVIKNNWVIAPPKLPKDPRSMYPSEWFDVADRDNESANMLTSQPENIAVAQARALYDVIHAGRREAFNPGGKGYYDFHNFRWQAAKDAGTIDTLKGILANETHSDIKNAHEALQEALTYRMGTRYGR